MNKPRPCPDLLQATAVSRMKKLTITVSEELYAGLHARIGQGHIGRFLESFARPHVLEAEQEEGYRLMATDEKREAEAAVWADQCVGDVANEAR